jgi:uncharacterized membrane protein
MSASNQASDKTEQALSAQPISPNIRPLVLAGLVLGLGQAGFFDGIIFHQLLQWHHMFSSVETDTTLAGMELNTLGDGLFHLLDWLLTLAGIVLLWRAGRKAKDAWISQVFVGSILVGAGLFNLVEGIIDHHLLGIHHLKPGIHQGLWDIAFLASGALLMIIGLLMIQTVETEKAAL